MQIAQIDLNLISQCKLTHCSQDYCDFAAHQGSEGCIAQWERTALYCINVKLDWVCKLHQLIFTLEWSTCLVVQNAGADLLP